MGVAELGADSSVTLDGQGARGPGPQIERLGRNSAPPEVKQFTQVLIGPTTSFAARKTEAQNALFRHAC